MDRKVKGQFRNTYTGAAQSLRGAKVEIEGAEKKRKRQHSKAEDKRGRSEAAED